MTSFDLSNTSFTLHSGDTSQIISSLDIRALIDSAGPHTVKVGVVPDPSKDITGTASLIQTSGIGSKGGLFTQVPMTAGVLCRQSASGNTFRSKCNWALNIAIGEVTLKRPMSTEAVFPLFGGQEVTLKPTKGSSKGSESIVLSPLPMRWIGSEEGGCLSSGTFGFGTRSANIVDRYGNMLPAEIKLLAAATVKMGDSEVQSTPRQA